MGTSRMHFIKIVGLSVTGLFLRTGLKGSMAELDTDLPELLIDKDGKPIKSISSWIEKKQLLIKTWSDYLGIFKSGGSKPVVRILHEEKIDGLIRQYIEYENEPGMFVPAYVIKPQVITGPLPGVVALHSTSDNKMIFISGVEKGKITPLGNNLAKLGYVVICPLCFLWYNKGEKSYEQQVEMFQMRHPGSKGMAKMLFDAQRAVDVLVNDSDVDSERIGAIGHSLGGKEAFYLGAFDERVKVIVSNEGGIGIDFSNWNDPWYLGKEISNFDHEHHELLALCAPKPFLLIGGDSADGTISLPYINAVKPVYGLYGKPQNIELFNHGSGHGITPEAEKLSYDWIVNNL